MAGLELAGLARTFVTRRAEEDEVRRAGWRHARACRARVVVAAVTGPGAGCGRMRDPGRTAEREVREGRYANNKE